MSNKSVFKLHDYIKLVNTLDIPQSAPTTFVSQPLTGSVRDDQLFEFNPKKRAD